MTYTLMHESGTSLRGAGWSVVAQTRVDDWMRRKDHIVREWRDDQPKLRWEKAA